MPTINHTPILTSKCTLNLRTNGLYYWTLFSVKFYFLFTILMIIHIFSNVGMNYVSFGPNSNFVGHIFLLHQTKLSQPFQFALNDYKFIIIKSLPWHNVIFLKENLIAWEIYSMKLLWFYNFFNNFTVQSPNIQR